MTRTEIILKALGLDVVRVRGTRAWSLCPFHESDVTTAFFVRTSGEHAGDYHCYACKASGSLIRLAMHVKNLEWKAARDFVKSAGTSYEPPRGRVRVNEPPAEFTRRRFVMPPEVIIEPLGKWTTLAERYARRRGITDEEAERYGLGYAVFGRLEGRIVFPVRVPIARAVGYSARTFADAERKYLTPHESEGADLDAMFGEHLWPALGDRDVILVTEGAINALAAARATGFPASSISGSDVRAAHVLSLASFSRVVVLTDPDRAGDKAARGLAGNLARHTQVIRCRLPAGSDAADLAPARLQNQIHITLNQAL